MRQSALLSVFLLLLPAVAFTQTTTPAQPEFEVATFKRNTSGSRNGRIESPSNGRLTIDNVPLRVLILNAWKIRVNQLVGAPDWLGDDRYDIAAKGPANVSQEQIRLMVQSLFADRLKLVVHRETKEAPIYELTPAKGGMKLITSTGSDCVKFDPDHPPAPSTPGSPRPRLCGGIAMARGQLDGRAVPMGNLTDVLSNLLGRTVVDKTGATGNYDIHLEFAPDQATGSGLFLDQRGSGDATAPPSDSATPNIFTALQDQLGLKVQSAKGPVEFLVIDHVERPSEN